MPIVDRKDVASPTYLSGFVHLRREKWISLFLLSFFLFQLAFLVWAAILYWQLGIAISHCVFSPICMSGSFSDSSSSIRCVIYRTVLSPVSSGPLVEYRLSSFSSSSPFLSCRRRHHFSAAHFSKKPTGNSVRLVGAVEVGNMQAGRQRRGHVQWSSPLFIRGPAERHRRRRWEGGGRASERERNEVLV